MNILVTGGAGFIGSHTVLALCEAGYCPVVLDNLSNSKQEAVVRTRSLAGRDFPFYEGDICKKEDLQTVFERENIDAVIHFAGLKAVGESVQKPLEYYQNNVAGTVNLLQSMREYGVKKIVFSSSATVYGQQSVMPLTEEMPTGGVTNPYGRTKVMIEEILKDLGASDPAWEIALLRYFNPIGAHKSGRIGENPLGIPNNLMPYITQVAAGRLEKLHIFGDDYDTPDGTCIRDYIHVCDLAQGHLDMLAHLKPGVQTINRGTGRGVSVLELVKTFERVNHVRIPYVIDGRRAGDLPVCYADTAKAQREIGFCARFTVEDMCADSFRWQQQNPQGF